MKNNITFYRHEADSHRNGKFKMLRLKFGWAGEGKFWALHNIIAEADECVLDLNKKFVKSDTATELGFTMEEFEEFVEYLINDCELLLRTESGITTNYVQEILSQVMKKRKKNQSDYQNRISVPKEVPKKKEEPAPKKGKKPAKKKIQLSEFDVMLEEFKKMRKSIKKPMTDLAVKRLLTKLEKLSPIEAVQIKIMEQSIFSCWQDVYELKQQDGEIDWENLSIEDARKMMKDNKLSRQLEIKNPTLYFQAQ